jgi:REP element-mobilizing transposase RayT
VPPLPRHNLAKSRAGAFGTAFAFGRTPVAHPRRIVPGETYLVTRRCYQRTFRLHPCPQTNRIFLYCLAFAAERTGVLVHAVCVMSNHHHLVVTDVRGVLPNFLRELHRLTAKAMNASQGQWENLWAAEPCNVLRLVTDEDVDDKIAYAVANPVAAGLVSRPEDWPGVLLWGQRTVRTTRPPSYFRDAGTCPPEIALFIEPPVRRDFGPRVVDPGWRDRLVCAIAAKVAEARRKLVATGRRFLGQTEVLMSSSIQRARSYEERFGIVPTFAAKVRAVRERLRRVERHFRARYRAALERWRCGEREIAFPFGSWGVAVFHGAVVAPPPVA